MKLINSVTDDPNQIMSVVLEDGSSLALTLTYIAGLKGWYYSFTWGSYSVYNRRIVKGINAIRALRGILPFGIFVDTTDGYEPIYIDDFSKGRATLYTLSQTDVDSAEQQLSDAKV